MIFRRWREISGTAEAAARAPSAEGARGEYDPVGERRARGSVRPAGRVSIARRTNGRLSLFRTNGHVSALLPEGSRYASVPPDLFGAFLQDGKENSKEGTRLSLSHERRSACCTLALSADEQMFVLNLGRCIPRPSALMRDDPAPVLKGTIGLVSRATRGPRLRVAPFFEISHVIPSTVMIMGCCKEGTTV